MNKEAIEKLETLLRLFDGEKDPLFTWRQILEQSLAFLRAEEPPQGEPKVIFSESSIEFTKRVRKYIAERPIDEPKGLVDDLLEACDIIDRQAAEYKDK